MARIRLHIDPRGVDEKPTANEWGGISRRVLRSNSIKEVTVQQLAQKIETGHTICPAVLDGSKAADWQEQQVFMVDIDNADKEQSQLSQEQALAICSEYGLTPAIYYQTFSHSRNHPKFRLVFVMDSVVTDPSTRRMIVERLISIFRRVTRRVRTPTGFSWVQIKKLPSTTKMHELLLKKCWPFPVPIQPPMDTLRKEATIRKSVKIQS